MGVSTRRVRFSSGHIRYSNDSPLTREIVHGIATNSNNAVASAAATATIQPTIVDRLPSWGKLNPLRNETPATNQVPTSSSTNSVSSETNRAASWFRRISPKRLSFPRCLQSSSRRLREKSLRLKQIRAIRNVRSPAAAARINSSIPLTACPPLCRQRPQLRWTKGRGRQTSVLWSLLEVRHRPRGQPPDTEA